MSITPVDKPPDEDDAPNGPLSRRSSSLRAHVGRIFSWVADRAADVHSLVDGTERSPATGQVISADRPRSVHADGSGSLSEFPERERPLTYPARDVPGVNSPDVVSVETKDGLRLSVPENPDATLTSDVWTTVDP